jgi:tyrosyl-tRNA synthetase
MKFEDVIEIASHYTVAQLLERDDFEKRYNQGYPIGIHEFLYPLIQGYDSVVLKSDIEICGTDQRFNSIVARTFQQAYDQEPEVIMMMPILEGIGTKEKMSKSLGNYVGIEDKPEDMFGKIMRITDEQINDYFTLCTQLDKQQIEEIDKKVENPKEKKERLAYEIVKFYHNEKAAQKAKEIFEIKHGKSLRDKEDKLQVKEQLLKIAQEKVVNKQHSKNNKIWICKLLNVINAVSSNSEARRLIQQKGIKIDSKIIEDTNLELAVKEKGYLLQVGRRKVYKILFK